MRTHQLVAFNTAINSDNKIHDDDVAQKFGFSGGLVPGVDVYAYLCWGPVSEWGQAWLERGTAEVRFGLPTYDGDAITVEWDAPACAVRNAAGVVVANGTMALPQHPAVIPDPARYRAAAAPAPDQRPDASPDTLVPGTQLGSWVATFRADAQATTLEGIRESLPLYRELGVAHPAWLLRTANWALSENVVLGPWMHVGSTVTHFGLVHDGAEVATRGTVSAEYEKKGHRFCDLDLLVVADGAPVAHISHTAIYLPRQVAAA